VWDQVELSTRNPLLRDQVLRRAVLIAVDRQVLVNRLDDRYAVSGVKPGSHLLQPGQPGYADTVTASGQGSGNHDRAAALLRAAGYQGVDDTLRTSSGTPVRLRCVFADPHHELVCNEIQRKLILLGITVTIDSRPQADIVGRHDFDIAVLGLRNSAFPVTAAQELPCSDGVNVTGLHDPALDALLDAAVAAPSPGSAGAVLTRADRRITAAAVSLPIASAASMVVADPRFANFRDNRGPLGPAYNIAMWGFRS
jgi:peptide/nickel transport system substrate-binding protein